MSEANKYPGAVFYAEKESARKGAKFTGTVLVVDPRQKNGICVRGIAVPKGDRRGVPCPTWISPDHLARRCVQVTESQAREIHPEMFAAIEKFERSPEYRQMHYLEILSAYAQKRYPMQPALNVPEKNYFHALYGV